MPWFHEDFLFLRPCAKINLGSFQKRKLNFQAWSGWRIWTVHILERIFLPSVQKRRLLVWQELPCKYVWYSESSFFQNMKEYGVRTYRPLQKVVILASRLFYVAYSDYKTIDWIRVFLDLLTASILLYIKVPYSLTQRSGLIRPQTCWPWPRPPGIWPSTATEPGANILSGQKRWIWSKYTRSKNSCQASFNYFVQILI